MLQWMVESARYFTLDDFNCRLENIELGHMESKSRPSIVSGKTLTSEGNSLKQNGWFVCITALILLIFSFTDVASRTDFVTSHW